ncbi:MAG: hypothetical protein R3F13_06110 [Prosthecobacter sp.]
MKHTLLLAFFAATIAQAEDIRLQPPKDLNGYFPFNPPSSLSEWDERREQVRRQILVAEGLWPMPTKTPLNAVIHGKVEGDGFTVERVYFESAPGFYVTGSLWKPKEIKGKVLASCSRTVTGRTHVSRWARMTRCARRSPQVASVSSAAGRASSSRSACSSPAWAASCGSGTC